MPGSDEGGEKPSLKYEVRYTSVIITMNMDNKQKKLLTGGIAGLALIIIIAAVYFTVFRGGAGLGPQEVSTSEPVDIVMDFYTPWLDAAQSTSTDPYAEGLAEQPILSKALRAKLKDAQDRGADEVDPVLCHVNPPEKITARTVYALETETQILVMARDKTLFEQALINLKKHNEGWYIDDINCSAGEFAPEREFTFEKEGFLLKNVPAPLDSQRWHIVFEEDGELGHFAPLFFDANSKCKPVKGDETVCAPDQFTEASKVQIKGQMIEAGVEVKFLTFVE